MGSINWTFELYAANQSLQSEIAGRKRAGEMLAKSESKYCGLVDNSLIGVFNTNIAGQFSFVNDAMVQIFDFESTEQMLASNSHSLWANPEHREQMLSLLKKHGKLTNFEAENVTHTGKHIHVIFSATLIDENIAGMGMEITKRKQAEEKVLEYQ
jgi:PAS domain S-box-containing protein